MADQWLRGLRDVSSTPRTTAARKTRASDDGGASTPHAPASEQQADTGNKRATAAPVTSRVAAAGRGGPPITPPPVPPCKPPLPAAAKMTPRQGSARVPPLSLGPRVTGDASDDDDLAPSMSADGSQLDDAMEGDSVQVFVRVRPCNATELEAPGAAQEAPCMRTSGESTIIASIPGKNPKHYTYDKVLPEAAAQHDVFEAAGIPMVDNCISGYNSSIFVYGQTGAGKTFTMMGDLSSGGHGDKRSEQRGLAPRMIELLFEKISHAEDAVGRDALRYSCRCSCLEIYNETITDLLNPAASALQMREDPARGIYVDELSEKEVFNVEDVLGLMAKGNRNRHVGETNMNARSSRSHCVFTCVVERTSKNSANGVTSVVCSRLNLIDLAGSERIKGGALGGSQAQGEHFREAVHINQSLTTLGRVIMELVEAQKAGRQGQGHHIPYRDSRLTFLLQDSLGGNAKTMIIANVSPSPLCAAETVSTLKFVARAKCIRNKATINLDYRGDVAALQRENVRLNIELDNLRKGFTDPAIQENKELRQQLKSAEKQHVEDELRMQALAAENARFKKEHERMRARMLEADEGNNNLYGLMEQLQARFQAAEQASEQATAASDKVQASLAQESAQWQQHAELVTVQLQQLQESSAQQCSVLVQEGVGLRAELAASYAAVQELVRETAALKAQAEELEEAKATLAALYAEAREGLEAEKGRHAEAMARVAALEGEAAVLASAQQGFAAERAGLEAQLEEAGKAAAERKEEMEALRAELAASGRECEAAQERVKQAQAAHETQVAGLMDRAAEQERRLRGEIEAALREQQSQRLQLAESELQVAAGRDKVAGLAAALAAAQAAVQAAELRGGELAAALRTAECAAADAEARALAAEQGAEELRKQLAHQSSCHDMQDEESRREAGRLGGEVEALRGQMAELQHAVQAAEAAGAEQAGVVAQLRQAAEAAAAKHARELAELSQERSRLAEEVAAAAREAGVRQAELEAVRRAAEQATADAAAGRQKLAAALQAAAAAEATLAAEHEDRVRGLQREIIGVQERLVAREFELASATAASDKLRRELSDARAVLAAREGELAEVHSELKSTYDGRSELECQMKGFLVTNTRQARAFQEIRRLINWATTPPSSAASSLVAHDSGTPMGLAGDDLVPVSPGASPEPQGLGQGHAAGSGEVDQPPHEAPGAADSGSFHHRAAVQKDGQERSPVLQPSARQSLQFELGGGEEDGQGQGPAQQHRLGVSPGGSVRSKQQHSKLRLSVSSSDDKGAGIGGRRPDDLEDSPVAQVRRDQGAR